MTTQWTWDKHHEDWGTADATNGGTSVYTKVYVPGVSLQRVVVRFSCWSGFGGTGFDRFYQPPFSTVTLTLANGIEQGPVDTLAYELTAGAVTSHRSSDTDPAAYQAIFMTYAPISWDISPHSKNLGFGGTNHTLVLSVHHELAGTQFADVAKPFPTRGALQFDALFSQVL